MRDVNTKQLMRSISTCLICGKIPHRKGCSEYKRMLLELYGDLKTIIIASDNKALPKPPWMKSNN